MAAPTTNAHLLDGVGEFPSVTVHEIETLLQGSDREKGLDGGALTNWHNSAWERVKNDFGFQGLDVDTTLSDTDLVLLRAACCFRIMADLYRRNSGGNKESADWANADWHEAQYDRMVGRWQFLSSTGKTVSVGQGIRIERE